MCLPCLEGGAVNLASQSITVHANLGGVARCNSGSRGKRGRRPAVWVETELEVNCKKCLAMESGTWKPVGRGGR